MSSPQGIGSEIYTGAADFGRVWAMFTAIFATIIGVVMIAAGVFILLKKPWPSVAGTITAIDGSPTGICPQNGNNFSCNVTVSYKYNGESYTQGISYTGSAQYHVGEAVKVYLVGGNPQNINIVGDIPKWVGGILIVFSLIAMGASWFWVWASNKYKFIAAAEGASAGLGLIKNAL
jgi:hypothetical protein